MADQLTLFQPGGRLCTPHYHSIPIPPPNFQTFLRLFYYVLTILLINYLNAEGYEDADFVVIGGNSPDTIPIPGEISMDINQLIKVDLPSDLVIKMDLTKLDPFPLTVPCLNGLGSW